MLDGYIKNALTIQGFESLYFALISFLTVIVIGNYLSPELFGVYTALLVFVNIVSELADLGFKQIIIREQSSDKKIGKFLVFLAITSLFLVCIFELLLIYISSNSFFFSEYKILKNIDFRYAQIFVILIFPLTVNNFYTAVFRKKLEFRFVSIVRSISVSIVFALTIIITLIYRNYWGLLLGLLAGELFKIAIYTTKWNFSLRDSNADLLDDIKRGFGIYLAHIFGFLGRNIDYVIISAVLSVKQVGIYALAYKLMQAPIKQIGGVVNKVMFPVYGQMRKRQDVANTFTYTINIIFLYSAIIFSILSSASQLLSNIFLSEQWSSVGPVLGMVSLAGVFLLVHNACEPLLKNLASQRWLVIRQCAYFLMIAIFVYLGSLVDLMWAVTGVVVSLFLTSILSLTMAISTLKVKHKRVFLTILKLSIPAIIVFGLNTIILFQLAELSDIYRLGIILMVDLALFYILIIRMQTFKQSLTSI